MKPHRNSQKRIHIPDAAYFITVKTQHNKSFFTERIFCDLFVENLRVCKRLKEFKLYGWVLCLDHFHLLIRPMGKWNYSKILQHLKRNFSHNANVVMGIIEGANNYSRLQWGYCTMLNRYRIQFILKDHSCNQFPQFRWQKSFHDHYIRNESDYRSHLEYIIDNLAHHTLPQDWPYVFTNPRFDDILDS